MSLNPSSVRKLRLEWLEPRKLMAADVISGTLVDHVEVMPYLSAGEVGGGVLEPGTMFGPTHGGSSTLRRSGSGISYDLYTTGLPAGAYSVWVVAFNDPAECIDGCSPEDLLRPEPNPAMFWSTGGVVGDNGVAHFHDRIEMGEMPSEPGQSIIGTDGIADPQQAEIHLVVRYHGAASDDPTVLHEQISTLLGSCEEGANAIDYGPETFGLQCFDPQVAVHKPLPLPGDVNADGALDPADIDFITAALADGSDDAKLDLDHDGTVDRRDREYLIDEVMTSIVGDTDLDGDVDFVDFLALSSAYGVQGGWGQGDFDASGTVDFEDFVLLSNEFGNRNDRVEVVAHFAAGEVGGGDLIPGSMHAPTSVGHSTLRRTSDSISYELETSGLPPGAYSVWVVAFNNPTECIDSCSPEDLLRADPDPSMFWSTGGVVGDIGETYFQDQIKIGEMPGEPGQSIIGANGIADARHTEVHLVLRYHGPASADPTVLHGQISTLLGSCEEGANAIDYGPETFGLQCFDPQVAVHKP